MCKDDVKALNFFAFWTDAARWLDMQAVIFGLKFTDLHLSAFSMLQVGTVVEVLDRLSPAGPVKSTYPLTFVQVKQVRIPLADTLQ